MKTLFLDVETTGATNGSKGNPFTIPNRLCYVGMLSGNTYVDWDIEYSDTPYGKALQEIRDMVLSHDLLVGFNIRFDLHWLLRYGLFEIFEKKVFDCQLAKFLLSRQTTPFPSLDGVCEEYGLGKKEDVVRTEFWEKGLDTDAVPEEILRSYLQSDVSLTRQVYEAQVADISESTSSFQRLVSIENQDILVLTEMEWNGVPYDLKKSLEKAESVNEKIKQIDGQLNRLYPSVPINYNSGDHLSVLLYGGFIKEDYRETFDYVYKDGRTRPKERWAVRQHQLPALVEPLPKTELKKAGFYKTDEATLRKLKGNKQFKEIIDLLLERAKLEKLKGTYHLGLPKLHAEMQWEDNILHGQLNKCIAATGRLASKKPNQQNFPDETRELITTRFK